MEAPSAVYARARGGLIEGFLRRPLGNGVIALAAFIQADVNRLHGVEHFRATLGQQVHEPRRDPGRDDSRAVHIRSEEHTSELQSLAYLVCRLLLEKKKKNIIKLSIDTNYIIQLHDHTRI